MTSKLLRIRPSVTLPHTIEYAQKYGYYLHKGLKVAVAEYQTVVRPGKLPKKVVRVREIT
jgi:hypothetical protein